MHKFLVFIQLLFIYNLQSSILSNMNYLACLSTHFYMPEGTHAFHFDGSSAYLSSFSCFVVSLTVSLVSYFSRLLTNHRNNMCELYCCRTPRQVSFFIARIILFLCFLSATMASSISRYTPLLFILVHILFCSSAK